MSISLAIPAVVISGPNSSSAGVQSVTAALLADPNSHAAALPVVAPRNSIASIGANAVSSTAATSGLDPLTPRSTTPSDVAALTSVIGSVTSTLNSVQSNNGLGGNHAVNQGVSQLLQSPTFLQLFQTLGTTADPAGSAPVSNTTQLSDLLAASPDASSGTTTTVGTDASAPAGTQSGSATYFHKLMGELANTFGASSSSTSTTGSTATFLSSELEQFLKWLSLHGSNGVVASA